MSANWKLHYAVNLLLLTSLKMSHAQEVCLQEAVPFRDLGRGKETPRIPNGRQAITSYQFQCCGDIFEWGTYVEPAGRNHVDGAYTIHFQVWRPSPTSDGTGCYSLVGENRFVDVTFNTGEPISETPELTNTISVQPGDVVGYYAVTALGDNDGVQVDNSTDRVTIYYNDDNQRNPIGLGPDSCQVSVGPGGQLTSSTRAAPLISIDISTYACPVSSQPLPMTTSAQTAPSTSTASTQVVPTQTPLPVTPPEATTHVHNIESSAAATFTSVTGLSPIPTNVATTSGLESSQPTNTVIPTTVADNPADGSSPRMLITTIAVCLFVVLVALLAMLFTIIAVVRRKYVRSYLHNKTRIYTQDSAPSINANNVTTGEDYVEMDANAYMSIYSQESAKTNVTTVEDYVDMDAYKSDHLPNSHTHQKPGQLQPRQNKARTSAILESIPMNHNECYGTADPDHIYSIVEPNATHTAPELKEVEYEDIF